MIREGKGRYKRPEKGKEGRGTVYLLTPWKHQIERWWVISVFPSEALPAHS